MIDDTWPLWALSNQNQFRICIRCKSPDTAREIIHASCSSSLYDVESSYRYANIIQIMINTQLARQLLGREHVLGVFYPLFTPYHVTMIVSWWNLCSLPPAPGLSRLATGPRRLRLLSWAGCHMSSSHRSHGVREHNLNQPREGGEWHIRNIYNRQRQRKHQPSYLIRLCYIKRRDS